MDTVRMLQAIVYYLIITIFIIVIVFYINDEKGQLSF